MKENTSAQEMPQQLTEASKKFLDEMRRNSEEKIIGHIWDLGYTCKLEGKVTDVYVLPGSNDYFNISCKLLSYTEDEIIGINTSLNKEEAGIYHFADCTIGLELSSVEDTLLLITNPNPEKRKQAIEKLEKVLAQDG